MKEIVDRFRRYVLHLGILSFVIDVLMLTQVFFLLAVLDKVVPSRSNETLFVIFAIALYAVLVLALFENLRSRLFARFGATLKADLAPRLLTINLSGFQASAQARSAMDDATELERFLTGSGIKAFFAMPWIPLLIGVLYIFHPALAATVAILAVLLLVLALLEERLTAARLGKAAEAGRRAAALAGSARQNAEAVASLGMQQAVAARWAAINAEATDEAGRAARISALINAIARFVRVGGQMSALAVGAWLLLNLEGVTQGIMIAALILTGRTLGPIEQVIGAWKSFIGARAAFARLKTLLDEEDAALLPALQLPRPHGHIAVERLVLLAGPGQRILAGVSFKLPAGESLGIVGPSGSGKTSLARAIVGLLRPTQGHVRLDGAEVSQWAQTDLGQYVGYLPQEVVLFSGTIAENIARMKDPELHHAAIISAAKKARVHGMILALPKGYDTEVGDGGARLSGGQRQLVGLARALFGNPSLVVLDEPNANLDSTAELALGEVIRGLKVSRVTLVIIAHKPSVIRDMDRLLVLRGGEQSMYGKAEDVFREINAGRLLDAPATSKAVAPASKGGAAAEVG